ncbi:hypothetical protein TVAG_149490 [Trichomonas vaginalis G3]|uniref:Microbial-type PARG catalytic domain-containing protein n=1 Tax=Trichomonas vaginalis (strain ATCC PRA-98 / G3) TaxID=412133 RepID=A2ELL6_TRIV3|nr:hypothetical protein TVAGG3_0163130 [Trichomonas vaginalis G3]EAY06463.1 hypothetical protein TVAG_149490 [Trichomonas vaginalis G3]KAI5548009.1 hypothetical protein TVAGG3_0163130 [Trichomonas vaginalis G3]|eukprot:XP_001318686.1 hypothetical protein [Trichomonas vaginalis G3]
MATQFNQIHPSALETKNKEAKSCLDACVKGFFINGEGKEININNLLNNCLANTKAYAPDYQFHVIPVGGEDCKIEIRNESILDAVYRLVITEGRQNVCALNAANAFYPGGSFRTEARAPEETLCRSSALYYSLIQKPEYYDYNMMKGSKAASNYIIYSQDCPTWKVGNYKVLNEPFLVSYISSSPVDRWGSKPEDDEKLNEMNDERIKSILLCAIENGVKNLVLGAYGCGAYRNDPAVISETFRKYLIDQNLKSHFQYITFSITGLSRNIEAFQNTFHIHAV